MVFAPPLLAATAAALALPALAQAEERTLTFTTPAISVEGYGVAQQPMLAESPKVDGYVVGMEAEVVDAQGRVQGRDKVMLHHIVFAKIGVPTTPAAAPPSASSPRARSGWRSRSARLRLPEQGDRPLGAALHADEPQAAAAERLHPLHGALRHRRDADAGEADLARRPQLHRPRPRLRRPRRRQGVLDLHEDRELHDARERPARLGRRPPARRRRSGSSSAERDLRHDAVRLAPDLGRPEAEAAPARAGPDEDVLVPLDRRDPGREGRPAATRRGLRQLGAAHAGDGDHAPLPRAGRRRRLRRDSGARRRPRPPVRPAALLDAAAAGAEGPGLDRQVDLGRRLPLRRRADPPRRGTTFTWSFRGSVQHDVTVVGGPVGFSAPWTQSGVFRHRFTKPGTYRLFCSLHPAKMVQQITVR